MALVTIYTDVVLVDRYLVQNLDWLQDLLGEYSDEDYFIFDCPGWRYSMNWCVGARSGADISDVVCVL